MTNKKSTLPLVSIFVTAIIGLISAFLFGWVTWTQFLVKFVDITTSLAEIIAMSLAIICLLFIFLRCLTFALKQVGGMNRDFANNIWVQNIIHFSSSLTSIQSYSNKSIVNRYKTIFSANYFEIMTWKQISAIVGFTSFIIAIISTIYRYWQKIDQSSQPPSNLASSILIISLIIAFVTLVKRTKVSLPKDAVTDGKTLDVQLSNNRVRESYFLDDKSIFHLGKAKPRGENFEIITLPAGWTGKSGITNVIEFDTDLSKYLLDEKHDISFTPPSVPDQKGSLKGAMALVHRKEREILKHYDEPCKQFQKDAFEILWQTAARNGNAFFNAKKISLLDIAPTEGNGPVSWTCKVGTTSYYTTAITNDLSTKHFQKVNGEWVKGATNLNAVSFPAQPKTDGGYWVPKRLSETKNLSNQIGSLVLAVTSDKVPVFLFQNPNANINAGQSVVSGSGSLEFSDIERSDGFVNNSLLDVVKFGVSRELLEETALIYQDSYRACDMKLIGDYAKLMKVFGYYRDFRRGGQPIFVAFCKMEIDAAVIPPEISGVHK